MKKLLLSILLTWLLQTDCNSAIVEVNAPNERDPVQTNAGLDSTTIVLTNGATTGDFITVSGNAYDAPPASITVTAGCVPSFTVLSSAPAGVTRQFIAYGFANATGACTITINPAGSSAYISGVAVKFTGVHATPLDVDGGATNATGTTSTADITTVASNVLIISTHTNGTMTTATTPVGGLIEVGESDDNSCCTAFATGYIIATTPGLYSMEWNTADSVAYRMHTASFKPSVAGAPSNFFSRRRQ